MDTPDWIEPRGSELWHHALDLWIERYRVPVCEALVEEHGEDWFGHMLSKDEPRLERLVLKLVGAMVSRN